MFALFLPFCQTAEQVRATTKRLEKAALLGDYLSPLPDADLSLAARYFAGHLFPLRDGRTSNVGIAALMTAILQVSGADVTYAAERLVVLGDPGDVAGELLPPDVAPLWTLHELAEAFGELAATAGTKKKIERVTAMLQRATPLEGKYIVKLLSGDLRIGLKEGAVEDALARMSKVEVGQIQRANMLTGDIGEVALLARHERLGEARMRLFHPLKFMLATPAANLDDVARQMPTSFVVEDKLDGIRAQAHIAPHRAGDEILHGQAINGCRVALFSRTLDEITGAFPDLLVPLASLLNQGDGDGWILDGEIVPVAGDAILPFQVLQQRLGRKTPSAEVQAKLPVAFIAYDALYGDSRVLLEEPFETRRALLESLPFDAQHTRLALSARFEGVERLDEEFDDARARGNEGLMIKDPRASYKPGRRGREWLKIKRALATLDVVVTAVEVGSGRRAKFLSDYTFAVRASEDDPMLLNVGKAYSGLTDAEVGELSDWFKAHTLQEFAHGRVRTVEPKIVFEITFDRVQPSNRHKSGFALRFPRILRVRHDKPPEEIDTLETVRRLTEVE